MKRVSAALIFIAVSTAWAEDRRPEPVPAVGASCRRACDESYGSVTDARASCVAGCASLVLSQREREAATPRGECAGPHQVTSR